MEPKKHERKDPEAAWAEGNAARRAGAPLDSCPYMQPTEVLLKARYEEGWAAADEEIDRAEGRLPVRDQPSSHHAGACGSATSGAKWRKPTIGVVVRRRQTVTVDGARDELLSGDEILAHDEREQQQLRKDAGERRAREEREKHHRQDLDRQRERHNRSLSRAIASEHTKREIISFSEIADACARTGFNTMEHIYADLARWIRDGEFVEDGRLVVLLFEPAPGPGVADSAPEGALVVTYDPSDPIADPDHIRATVQALVSDQDEWFTASPAMVRYLRNCYLPRAAVYRFMERHGRDWPPHFDPEGQGPPASSIAVDANVPSSPPVAIEAEAEQVPELLPLAGQESHGQIMREADEPLASSAPTSSPAATHATRRELGKARKREMYDQWHALAFEYRHREDGTVRSPGEIAKRIAADDRAKDPTTKRTPAASTVIRQLNRDGLDWKNGGQKKVRQKNSARKCAGG